MDFCMFQKVVLPFLWRMLALLCQFVFAPSRWVSPFHRGHRMLSVPVDPV